MGKRLLLLSTIAGWVAAVTGTAALPWVTELEKAAGQVLYVSVAGDDTWTGRLPEPNPAGTDGPFATLEQARDEIRQVKEDGGLPPKGVTVAILEGRYERAETLVLAKEDSGTAASPIVYRGQPGVRVCISGGRVVDGWQPVTDAGLLQRLPPEARGNVIQADLKALGIAEYGDYSINVEHAIQRRVAKADGQGEYTMGSVGPKPGMTCPERLEVFFNDQPLQIARGPNDGHITLEEPLGKTPYMVRERERGRKEGIFRYRGDYPKRWISEKDAYICGSWSRDWAEQRHRVERLDSAERVISVPRPYHYYGYYKGQWFYGFNILAELDRPGEWYVDRESGTLILWPPERVKAPRIEVSMAPALVTMNGVSNVTFRGLLLEATRGTAVTMNGCNECRVIGCTMRNLGVHAVTVQDGRENRVIGCDMYGMGGGGVYLVAGDRKTLTPAGHVVENCHIHHYGRWDRMYRPGIVFSGVGLRASHNLIHDAPHSAIIFGGNDHVIEFNEIHSVCFDSNDCGAIYAGRNWTIRGHVIRHNYLHHIAGRQGRPCKGIYLDDSFAAATVSGNIFHKVNYAIFLGCGRDNIFDNNVFIDCPGAMHVDARALGWQKPHIAGRLKEAREKGTQWGIRFMEPPYSTRYPRLLTLLGDEPAYPKGNVVRRNIFWPGSGEDLRRMTHGAKPKDTWWDHMEPKIRHLIKLEDNLINEDPKFVDEPGGDFQLRRSSPAWALGFQRIPVKEIGLINDNRRASWPPLHSPRAMPRPPEPKKDLLPPPEKVVKRTLRTGPAPVFSVARTSRPITVDGVLSAAEWDNREPGSAIQIDKGLYHESVPLKSWAWMAHDGRNLYVGVLNDVDPGKPLVTKQKWARNDAVEIALRNPQAGRNAPILVLRGYSDSIFESSSEARAPADVVQAAGKTVTFAAKVVDPGHWTAEYCIPLTLLDPEIPSGMTIECNISVRKIAGPDWVMWQGTGGLTWETDKAGILKLLK
ncbi:MAG: hypothetical protein HN742_41225 [Lentisphaerae bacterium]|nr:hypothetical protein [Lentisphaerota bacterium]MBT5608376.1 hypothetical protein [Lentisphaerota bacterium]MBT7060993.1 hypothetical protein [Lentisphaerota bacterium]MBT7848360.1 hypothetical protein [Lentisphaerota bacterium]